MDYLEYKFNTDKESLIIEDYLEKHNKKKNLWWKSLKGINQVFNTHLDILYENASKFFEGKEQNSDNWTPKTAKSCPAIGNSFLNKIFLVKAPCDIFLSIQENGSFYYQTPEGGFLTVESHAKDQFHTTENNIFEGYLNIKFCFPILLSSKKCFMFLDPQYHTPDNGIKVLNGVIENEHLPQPLNINTVIKMDELEKHFLIKKGTVLCYLWSPNELHLKHNKDLKLKPKSTFFGRFNQ